MSDIKLHYFDAAGRAEAIRIVLLNAKIPFEDVRITNWQEQKVSKAHQFENSQLPVLQVGDTFIPQSDAILRYVGKKAGYYSDDALVAANIDASVGNAGEIFERSVKIAFGSKTDEDKKANTEALAEYLPKWADALEKRLAANSSQNYLVGNKVSIADVVHVSLHASFF